MSHSQSAVRVAVFYALASAFIACGGSSKHSADLLYDVRAYNEGVRWEKLPQAAVRIHPSEREAFLDEREQLQEELRIDDFEITRLKMAGKDDETANVQIKWTWHMDSLGIVHTTTSKQEWRRFGDRWIMLGEAHVWGVLMPGVPEEAKESGKKKQRKGKRVSPDSDEKAQAHRSVEASLQASQKTPRIAE